MTRTTLTSAAAAAAFVCLGAGPRAGLLPGDASTVTIVQPQPPDALITNGQIRARIHLPDAARGFYRSTRFDWSGVVASLEHKGHDFYGPWFAKSDPPVRDFVYRDGEIVTGAQSTMTGPAEEFQPALGYTAASVGGTFVKIGVGVLRRATDANYSGYANYEIVDAGKWTVTPAADRVSFTQEVNDPASGYGYRYEKTLRLSPGRPEMTIEHRLTNVGRQPIQATQYNHNFLTLDGGTTGPDIRISVPFDIKTTTPPDPAFAEIRGKQILYKKVLSGEDRVTFSITGFGTTPADYDITTENTATGAGVRVTADCPLARLAFWSIRSVVSMEPFVDVSTAPGATTAWTLTYTYFAK
ncbi:MAG: hypothetical protein IT184_15690 [Acidobacteria bacterium]|nr:hypothetical protein [Acidobacteriota bacterium]